jgi:glycosyltransferase involved in cell wall biosynthesis
MVSPSRCLFSVIVPTYGRPAFLDDAVRSVLTQTIDDLECIVVDDASPIPVRVPDDERVRVVPRIENGGPAAARNTGITNARGRYIVFLDDDDVLTPERLAIALEGLARAPIALCWRGNRNDARQVRNRTLDGVVHDEILEAEVPHLGQTAIEASIAPMFDERFVAAEDTEWWFRVSGLSPVTTVPRVGYLLRHHDEPRHRNDLTARVRYRLHLLETQAGYFADHPRAAGFQWKRIGLMAQRLGDHSLSRDAFVRSLRARPHPATLKHLLRSLHRSTSSVHGSAPLPSDPRSLAPEPDHGP